MSNRVLLTGKQTSQFLTKGDHSLRHHNFFQLPKANSTLFESSPLYFASHIFNILPKPIQSSTRLSEFKKKAQQYFVSPSCPCSMHALTSM